MPRVKLTDAAVQRIKAPQKGQADYFDQVLPGFALRVTDKGRRSWCVFYRHGGRLRRMTLGRYPALKLGDAREEAREALQAAGRGEDPAAVRRQHEADAAERAGDIFGSIADDFVERYAKRRQRSWRETKRILERYVKPKWGKRQIHSITRRDLIDLVDGLVQQGKPIMANRTLAAVRRL